MADVCFGNSVADAIYVGSTEQRAWFAGVLRSGVLVPCPRLENKPSRSAETNPSQSVFFC